MVNLFNLIRDKHALVFKLLLYFFCSVVISFLLPNGQKYSSNDLTKLNYWPYENLVTNSEFLFKKSTTEIKEEQLEIRSAMPLFFYENVESKNKSRAKFESDFSHLKNTEEYNLIKLFLDSIYITGVIENVPLQSKTDLIHVKSNGIIEKRNLSDYYTIESILKLGEGLFQAASNPKRTLQKALDYVVISLYYDKKMYDKMLAEAFNSISIYKSTYGPGEVLIAKNELLTEEKREIIKAYLQVRNNFIENVWLHQLGKFMIALILFGILMLYLAFFRKNIFGQNKQITFIYLVVLASVLLCQLTHNFGTLFFWSIPFALIPVLIRIFFDSRTALFTFLISVLLCSFYASEKFEFVFIQLIIGMGTIFSVAEMRRRKELLSSALVVFAFFLASFLAYHFMIGEQKILSQKIIYLPIVLSSLLILLAYPFIYLAEKVFGFVSDFTLMELCDLNSPLLRELSLKVPGTFQHSLQVANLAEEAIFHIGGNALLVRAGAMYHDIGKIENPRYFTENQVGELNPHNEILPEESAKIIISHVINGIEMAKANKIPESIIDFIRTHHGTTTAGFFLNNYKNIHKEENVNEAAFRYPGPIPFSKETAVLMMADGVEAASRSLKKYDALAINELVDRIIDYKISENQFINAEITFKDITIVKKIFKKRLMNMYHVRIEYPR